MTSTAPSPSTPCLRCSRWGGGGWRVFTCAFVVYSPFGGWRGADDVQQAGVWGCAVGYCCSCASQRPVTPPGIAMQGQQALFNVLKAYALHDLEVGCWPGLACVGLAGWLAGRDGCA